MGDMSRALILILMLGCASSRGSRSDSSSADYVTGSELRATGQPTLESALRDLRPRWFNLGRESVGFTRSGNITACRGNLFVYVDGVRENESLSQMPLVGIVGVQFLRTAGMRPDGNRNCPEVPAVNVLTHDQKDYSAALAHRPDG